MTIHNDAFILIALAGGTQGFLCGCSCNNEPPDVSDLPTGNDDATTDDDDSSIDDDVTPSECDPDAYTSKDIIECGYSICLNSIPATVCNSDGRIIPNSAECTPFQPLLASDNTCNGIDEDCDGETDEDYIETRTGNDCGGIGVCVGEEWRVCSLFGGEYLELTECREEGTPSTESCGDDIDSDCDGFIDDSRWMLGENCSAGIGECVRTGTLVCNEEKTGSTCNAVPGTPTGSDNNCNGVDENCNGENDDNYIPSPTHCGIGECVAEGLMVCSTGGLRNTCRPRSSSEEVCDGLDNNCDGEIDEIGIVPVLSSGSIIFSSTPDIWGQLLTGSEGSEISINSAFLAEPRVVAEDEILLCNYTGGAYGITPCVDTPVQFGCADTLVFNMSTGLDSSEWMLVSAGEVIGYLNVDADHDAGLTTEVLNEDGEVSCSYFHTSNACE